MEVQYDVFKVPIPKSVTTEERHSTKRKRNPRELLDVNAKKRIFSVENKTQMFGDVWIGQSYLFWE